MKPILGHALKALGVATTVFALTPACVENDRSIFVRAVLAPPQNRQNGECFYEPEEDAAFYAEGTVDMAATDSYFAYLLSGNLMRARANTDQTRSESNAAHINGAIVRVTTANGVLINEFTATSSSFIPAQENNAPGLGVVGVTLIDGPTLQAIKRTATAPLTTTARLVLANVKIFGETLGGVDLESGEFQYPIRVCEGCLIQYADDPAVNSGSACDGVLDATDENTLPCFPGQDVSTPCQLCLPRAACVNPLTTP